MTSYKTDTRVQVSYDPNTFSRGLGETEKWRPRVGVQRVISLDERRAIPPWNDEHPWITPFLVESRLSLDVDANRQMYIGGFERVPSVIIDVGNTSKAYATFGPNFRKAGLSPDQLDALGSYKGFPVQVRARMIKKNGQEGGSVQDDSWNPSQQLPSDQRVTYSGLGGVLEFRAWLGTPDLVRQRIPLIEAELSATGEEVPVLWPVDRTIRTASQIVDGEPTPSPLSTNNSAFATPPTSSGGTEWEFDTASFGLGIQGLVVDTLADYINAISDVQIINNPGQTDNDQVNQPQTEPRNSTVGPIDIDGSFASVVPPNYTATFWATVKASRLRTLIKDAFSGFEIQRPEHRMELEIEDRFAAGLGSSPLGLGSQSFPEYQINGNGYFLISIEESDTNRLRVVVSTENQT